ncbi:putative enzyme [Candidatus Methylacidithermus pantelleriae]|uniref:Putative enzyme n=1 Tax=Candidatus Methylacidithermus pantelleriae TaxID=2744239 RepID=A0A8J2BNE2_9BACT|nr:putative enzyme [Candidatus Methylacidithermus pantelleriae]
MRATEGISAEKVRHIPAILYHRAGAGESIEISDPIRSQEQREILSQALYRRKISARLHEKRPGLFQVHVRPELPLPPVGVIIPTRDRKDLLEQCLEGLWVKTDYPGLTVLVIDNGSKDPETLRFLSLLRAKQRIFVLRKDEPFHYSRLCNAGAAWLPHPILLFCNNDVVPREPGWLRELVGHAVRPEVGVVGPKLLYPNGTVQHAGFILSPEGGFHLFRHLDASEPGYMGRAFLWQSFSALTGACWVVRRSLYWKLGGMDEEHFPVTCGDIDFCLRALVAGYRNVWVPTAVLEHPELSSRGPDDTPERRYRRFCEVKALEERWGHLLAEDPAFHPHLATDCEIPALAFPPKKLPPWIAAEERTQALSQVGSKALRKSKGPVQPSSLGGQEEDLPKKGRRQAFQDRKGSWLVSHKEASLAVKPETPFFQKQDFSYLPSLDVIYFHDHLQRELLRSQAQVLVGRPTASPWDPRVFFPQDHLDLPLCITFGRKGNWREFASWGWKEPQGEDFCGTFTVAQLLLPLPSPCPNLRLFARLELQDKDGSFAMPLQVMANGKIVALWWLRDPQVFSCVLRSCWLAGSHWMRLVLAFSDVPRTGHSHGISEPRANCYSLELREEKNSLYLFLEADVKQEFGVL